MSCPLIVSPAHARFAAACRSRLDQTGCGVTRTFQRPRQEARLLTSPRVFTTGSHLAHVGRFEFSKIKFLAVNFIMGDKWCLCCFPSFLFKKTLSNIKALTTTVCLPFTLSSKNDVLRKVASSACNSNDCAVFLGRTVLRCADGSL